MEDKIAITSGDVEIIYNMATTLFQALSMGETLTSEEQELLRKLFDSVSEEEQQELESTYDQVVNYFR
ncbi:hypothetical protein [Tuberibacillus sp. Marseille-P3662]|uniref:hypothetical protein n=1 Tax=Tuberibacillus sp. Marseille-P3662 TaxID=1965358 RepID=UPI000A1CCD9C|nr:hypothetical protein [Tuberibacillus sp. Marseille-P3662]